MEIKTLDIDGPNFAKEVEKALSNPAWKDFKLVCVVPLEMEQIRGTNKSKTTKMSLFLKRR